MKIELSLQPELDPEGCGGAENHHVFDVFLEPYFGMPFGAHFCDFGSLLASLLETIFVAFWVQFLHRFLDPPKNIEKWKGSSAKPSLYSARSPLGLLLPAKALRVLMPTHRTPRQSQSFPEPVLARTGKLINVR